MGMGAFALAGCSAGQQSASAQKASDSNTTASASASTSEKSAARISLDDAAVLCDEQFGGVYINITIDDFNRLGFNFGDSVDVEFSNGYKLKDIPYFNGYYVNVGDPLLVGYPGYPHIEAAINYGDPLWEVAGLKDGDTATVTLREVGAYLNTQEAFDITYSDNRADFDSDVEFANFRTLAGGAVKPEAVYRSASPICNTHNRTPYVEGLMKQAGVAFILDLSDNESEIALYVAENTELGVNLTGFEDLRAAGCVALLDLNANYPSEGFARKLAAGLVDMSQHNGPYLVHCIEGKDRTGFVCILLEALCGATYDEMLSDYMATYANYYGITKESEPDKYKEIAGLHFNGMLRFLAGADESADLTAIDYTDHARDYLRTGGMTDAQIDALVARLTK